MFTPFRFFANCTRSPARIDLGPILFLLYVNDMPLAIRNGRTVLFADDTNILCNKETVNSTISDVSNWFRNNKLK